MARLTMLRIALIDVFMFSLPFLIYGAYMIAAKGAAPLLIVTRWGSITPSTER